MAVYHAYVGIGGFTQSSSASCMSEPRWHRV